MRLEEVAPSDLYVITAYHRSPGQWMYLAGRRGLKWVDSPFDKSMKPYKSADAAFRRIDREYLGNAKVVPLPSLS